MDLAEVNRDRAYLELGCKSLAQYAKAALGPYAGYADELLRIGEKLVDLPEVDRALLDGELTWEQVVVLTRVAVPKHELAWLETAVALPLEELQQLVERSAEGWAPPVAWDEEAQARAAAPGASVETPRAIPALRRAPAGEGRVQFLPRRARRYGAAHALGASERRFLRHAVAPNVRQRSHAPPSTS
jgi:hypothetical protein